MSHEKSAELERSKYREVRYEYTPNLPEILQHLKASLLMTTYQAGKLLILGAHAGKLTIAFSDFEQAMGLAVAPDRIAIGTRRQIHFYVPAHELSPRLEPTGSYDGCFVPRTSFYTGSIHGHDLAWGTEGLWVVNTLFSSLCTLHGDYNFVPRWRPPFISQLIDQDRCHLNGLALQDGKPRFVTVLAESDEPAGWRPTKAHSGCVLDVASGQVVARGFAMPHSPRVHQGRLWVLDSGNGRIGVVDTSLGRFETVEEVPGYTRGLAFAGQFAFVGLSKIREAAIFGGLPVAEKHEVLRCGLAVIDLAAGRCVSVFQFHSGVEEIFAVEVLPGIRNPMLAGSLVESQERDIWIVPPEDAPRPEVHTSIPVFARKSRGREADQVAPPAGPELVRQAAQLWQQGRSQEAETCFQQALATSDHPAALWVDLGNLQQEQGNQEGALESYRQALKVDPKCVAARQNLGYLLFNRGEPEAAALEYDQLLKLDPSPMNRLLATAVLPVVYDSEPEVARWRERVQSRLQSMVDDDAVVDARRQLVPTYFFLAYQGRNDRPIMELRGRVIQGAVEGGGNAAHSARRNVPSRRIRVGFVSAYFRDHTIGRLNIGRIEQLDRQRFDVSVAFASKAEDPIADRFRAAVGHHVDLPRDVAAARQKLLELDLDILIFADVGMDALTSTLAFSRMAPIQCVTWGHPDTTGSPTMDYFLSSQLLETDDADSHYTERLVRLPLLATYYERPRRMGPARDRSYFGLSEERRVYLCPQTLFKFHPEFDAVLEGILRADSEGDVIVLEGRVPAWTKRLEQRLARSIPDARGRFRFLPAQPRDDFLALLEIADVVIDPTHFGGGNSSYEALAMGAPLVTLPGEFLRSRITAALYRKMDFQDLVVASPDEMVARSVRLATDARYRGQMVRQMEERASVLFEDPHEVRVLENFLASVG